jgi:hypothetical protein
MVPYSVVFKLCLLARFVVLTAVLCFSQYVEGSKRLQNVVTMYQYTGYISQETRSSQVYLFCGQIWLIKTELTMTHPTIHNPRTLGHSLISLLTSILTL